MPVRKGVGSNSGNMMMKNIKNNEGISLIVALIFLLLSTLLGVSALRTSLLNEKMTLNSIQREQALQAAEGALLEAEADIANMSDVIISAVVTTNTTERTRTITDEALICQASFNGSGGGVCAPIEAQAPDTLRVFDNWVDVDAPGSLNVWTNSARNIPYTADGLTNGNGFNLVTQPRYIIEFMGYSRNQSTDGETNCVGSNAWQLVDWPYCSLDPALFRITAFATTGNLDHTRVMLQTTYVVN